MASQPANQPRTEVVIKDGRWFLQSSGKTEREETERTSHKSTSADRKLYGIWERSKRETGEKGIPSGTTRERQKAGTGSTGKLGPGLRNGVMSTSKGCFWIKYYFIILIK